MLDDAAGATRQQPTPHTRSAAFFANAVAHAVANKPSKHDNQVERARPNRLLQPLELAAAHVAGAAEGLNGHPIYQHHKPLRISADKRHPQRPHQTPRKTWRTLTDTPS